MHTDGLRPGLTPPGFLHSGGGHVNAALIAAELDALAERVARLRPPSSHNPHAFHEDRSELAHDIRAIALHLGERPAPVIAATERMPARSGTYRIEHAGGRTTLVVNLNLRNPNGRSPSSPDGP